MVNWVECVVVVYVVYGLVECIGEVNFVVLFEILMMCIFGLVS